MNYSAFHVWSIVLLSTNMQNMIVNRFRRRSDAEECLRLLQRAKPGKSYTLMYISLENTMQSIPTEWHMFTEQGNAKVARMMGEVRAALSEYPLPKVRSMLRSKIDLVAKSHPEVYDTAVRDSIVYRLTNWAREDNELSMFELSSSYWDL